MAGSRPALRCGRRPASALYARPPFRCRASTDRQPPSPADGRLVWPVLIDELLTFYEQEGEAFRLPRVTPCTDYLAWLARQDRTAALAAWREALAGLEEATHLCGQKARHKPVAPSRSRSSLKTLTASLNEQARRRGVTLNTMLQAAWALLLGRRCSRDDVVFGTTVAGRPPELAGVERMVGLFINTLPVRVRLPPGEPFNELVEQLQDDQSYLLAHQHLGLAEIKSSPDLATCSTRCWCSRTTRSSSALVGGCARSAAARLKRARCHPLCLGDCRDSGRAAAVAVGLSAGRV